jgi:hypothetical protein
MLVVLALGFPPLDIRLRGSWPAQTEIAATQLSVDVKHA